MKKDVFVLFLFLFLHVFALSAQSRPPSFVIDNGEFLLNGKPIKIHSGEMHYPRVPKGYWRHRFRMMKAMGLNTVATYVFWNYHNTQPGVWDFTTGNHNLAEYIRTAQEEGLFVILRPGPYVCAEWEFGGYPWWLQNNSDLIIRSNGSFLDSCKVYIHKLSEQVKDLQISRGGPIIMVQVENEFGSYVIQRQDVPAEDHKKYYLSVKQLLTEAGFDVPFFTSDGSWLFSGGAISGVLPTANGEDNIDNLKKAVDKYHNHQGPYMVAEFYPGWLDHWGESFVRVNTDQVVKQTEKYLLNNISFNFYMVHGGTNFAFTGGANYNNDFAIQPDITSYDYDAPISEAGWATPKYLAIRDLMKQHADVKLPDIPEQIPVITLPDISLTKATSFFEWKDDCPSVANDRPLTFEELGQGYGYVLYKKRFNQPISGELKMEGLRDYALVFVNGKKIGELNRISGKYAVEINIPFDGTLEILVENMGRINYGAQIPDNKKGIISAVRINEYEISGNWEMFKIPMDTVPDITRVSVNAKPGEPAIYTGSFMIEKLGDTFLDMRDWGKGVVFLNGHNLGRYWNIGPQQTLYLPGCWLVEGNNKVVIFEQQNDHQPQSLKTIDKPILEDLKSKT